MIPALERLNWVTVEWKTVLSHRIWLCLNTNNDAPRPGQTNWKWSSVVGLLPSLCKQRVNLQLWEKKRTHASEKKERKYGSTWNEILFHLYKLIRKKMSPLITWIWRILCQANKPSTERQVLHGPTCIQTWTGQTSRSRKSNVAMGDGVVRGKRRLAKDQVSLMRSKFSVGHTLLPWWPS